MLMSRAFEPPRFIAWCVGQRTMRFSYSCTGNGPIHDVVDLESGIRAATRDRAPPSGIDHHLTFKSSRDRGRLLIARPYLPVESPTAVGTHRVHFRAEHVRQVGDMVYHVGYGWSSVHVHDGRHCGG